MNNDLGEAQKLASEICQMAVDEVNNDVQIVVAPPAIHIHTVARLCEVADNVATGAQNCYHADSGAFTGEISVPMLKSVGASYVIIGHSERREYFGETDADIALKVDNILTHGLTPIFCCGESLEVRKSGNHVSFVTGQIKNSLFHLTVDQLAKVVIAYEPIWAIGTGVTASADQAQEMHAALRDFIASAYPQVAPELSILYGGSCKPSNAKELFALADVDGGLIGGASLNARDFIDVVNSFG